MLVLEGVGIGGTPVHQAVDHVLVAGAEDPLANHQALHPHRVLVEVQGVELLQARELLHTPELTLRLGDDLGQVELVPELARGLPVVERADVVVVIVQEGGTQELVGRSDPVVAVRDVAHQVLEDLGRPFQTGSLKSVILVSGLQESVGSISQEQPGRLEPVLLDGVVQRGLVLDILGVDERAIL